MDLKPCPFCGSTDLTLDHLGDDDSWSVDCKRCHAQFPSIHWRAGAIAAWNNRAAPAEERSSSRDLSHTAGSALDAERLSQASVCLHQAGHHDLGEYLDSLWNPETPAEERKLGIHRLHEEVSSRYPNVLDALHKSELAEESSGQAEPPPTVVMSTGEIERLMRMADGLERSAKLDAELAEELAGDAQFAMIHRTAALDLKAEADALRKLLAGAVITTPAEARADQAGAICTTDCFECGHALEGPWCPACNPEMRPVWRDVASDPPKQGEPCLFWWPGAPYPFAARATDGPVIWMPNGGHVSLQHVTRWMPLPTPPKAEADR